MFIRRPDDFSGGGDLGPIEGGTGWVLACVYTLGALIVVLVTVEMFGACLSMLASVIGP